MTGWEIAAVFLAGVAAGTINAVVGSGTLVTFPTLVAFGVPPITATVSNTVGLAPGAISGAWGYRRELAGQRARLIRLGSASVIGAVGGVALLLGLPSTAFETIVPILVSIGCILVIIGPWLSRRVAHRRSPHQHGGTVTWLLVGLAGVYGGYFAAAQGVILTGILGITLNESLQRINAAKNVLTSLVNTVAAICFIVVAHVSWPHTALIAVGSVLGGQLGAHVGRRLPSVVLRGVIVVIGVIAVIMLLRR
ncbi:MAG TPA: sulfite exporter TauE/SafE family protein [Actinopolymorphaceae bacterium]|nr:sulfite exporter TauE/SafE family protein [Actinopolymorphaceae bacterium]